MTRSLVNDDLTLFSYEILGLVGRGGAGAHDLLRMAQRGRILAWAGASQYYVEPKRLARLGYLDARKAPVKSELLLRLLIADLVGEAATRKGIGALREDIADLLDRLEQTEASAQTLPHRRKYLLLVSAFLRRLLDLRLELVDEVERELAPKARKRSQLHAQKRRRSEV